jgi:hypothetical protein
LKSHASDYLEVVQAIYTDACAKCGAEVSMRDLKTIRSRVKSQGISFLTITLPNFCADFERSLADGFVGSNRFQSFRKRRSIPAFLQGMISLIFDMETGRIFDDFNTPTNHAHLVDSVRQICLAFKKIELACTPKWEARAMEAFLEIERSFEMFSLSREDDDWFSIVSSVLWDNIMANIRLDMLVPRHGPGQTAERISGNSKFVWRRWHDRLEPYFPLIDSAYPLSCGELDINSEELKIVSIIPEEEEQPVRVTPVPKTLKGPRVIAIEPCCMQYAQQAIRDQLYSLLESSPRTSGHINFRDQSVNQEHALTASSDGRLATIDLSDASDRVPRSLALRMFRSNPSLMEAIDACRSKRAEMPDGTIVPLNKFASMGSALCFPVEAMYFYTICIVALLRSQNLPVSQKNADLVSSDVYVYGDDIIVPSHIAPTILDYLRKYNCKVNDRKTFWTGKFRESCGVDAYSGVQVTPVYIGTAPPESRQQASLLLSWLAGGNLFFKKGYLRTAHVLFSKVERVLGPLPSVPENSPVLGRHQPWRPIPFVKRWNRKLQRLEIKCWIPSPVYRTDKLDGYAALQKSLSKLNGQRSFEKRVISWKSGSIDFYELISYESSIDPLHLERSALHGEVAIHRRWAPATLVSGYRQ